MASVLVTASSGPFRAGRVVRELRAMPHRPCVVTVDATDAVDLEPLSTNDVVVVKDGQTVAVKLENLRAWNRATWPVDNTEIPHALAVALMPELQTKLYLSSRHDEMVWQTIGAETVLVPTKVRGTPRALALLRAKFNDTVTASALVAARPFLEGLFRQYPQLEVVFTPWIFASSNVDGTGWEFALLGPDVECPNRVEHTFEQPEPVLILTPNHDRWVELPPNAPLQVQFAGERRAEAKAWWKQNMEWAPGFVTTRQAMSTRAAAMRAFFGRWAGTSLVVTSYPPDQPPDQMVVVPIIGPMDSTFLSHLMPSAAALFFW